MYNWFKHLIKDINIYFPASILLIIIYVYTGNDTVLFISAFLLGLYMRQRIDIPPLDVYIGDKGNSEHKPQTVLLNEKKFKMVDDKEELDNNLLGLIT